MAPRTPKTSDEKPARTKAEKPKGPAKDASMKSAKAAAASDDGSPVRADRAAEQAEASGPGGMMKLKDLIDSVTAKTGGKKPEVKAAVEATLAALGEALATGKSLAVPPLGKLRVVKNKGPALTLKLRLADGAKAVGLALADDGEDG
jgi:Bacterial DNA-binding protein